MMGLLQTYGLLLGAIANLFAAVMWNPSHNWENVLGKLAFVVCAVPALLIVARQLQ